MMVKIETDPGAVKFVLGGAHVMCPGLTNAFANLPDGLPEGAPVAVHAKGKAHAMAVGVMKMSSADMCVGVRVGVGGVGWECCRESGTYPSTLPFSASRKTRGLRWRCCTFWMTSCGTRCSLRREGGVRECCATSVLTSWCVPQQCLL